MWKTTGRPNYLFQVTQEDNLLSYDTPNKDGRKDKSIFCDTEDEPDPLLRAIKKYSRHPSILRIKQYFKIPTEFSFVTVNNDVIAEEIKNLDTKKAVPQVKILKLNNNIFSQYLSQIFNENTETADFPNELKYADITPVYQKTIDTK